MSTFRGSFNIIYCTFDNNAAAIRGGVTYSSRSTKVLINNISRTTSSLGTLYYLDETSAHFSGYTFFMSNSGSLYSYNSNVTFSSYTCTRFEHCFEPPIKTDIVRPLQFN